VGISHGTVGAYLKRAEEAELSWEEAEKLSDGEVEAVRTQQLADFVGATVRGLEY
jgi:hypothetical protein